MDKIEKVISLINNFKYNEAQRVLNDIIRKHPNDFNAINLSGIIFAKKKEYKIAIDFFNKALEINPNSSDVYHNRGNLLREIKEFKKSILDIEKALKLEEKFIYYNTLGCIYSEIGENEKAKENFIKSYSLNNKYCEPLNNLARIKIKNKDINHAIELFKKSLSINNTDHTVLNDLGTIFLSKRKFDEALRLFTIGIKFKPDDYNLNHNLGNLFSNEDYIGFNFETASEFYNKAIFINKKTPNAYINFGVLLKNTEKFSHAIKNFNTALDLEKDYSYDFLQKKTISARAELLDCRLKIFDWFHLEQDLKIITSNYQEHKNINPLSSLYFFDKPLMHKEIAEEYVLNNTFIIKSNPYPEKIIIKDKINIAYFSSDFGNHAVTHLILGLLKNHNRNNFRVFAFSLKNKKDKYQDEIKKNVDLYFDVEDLSDDEIINMSSQNNIHIGIDLNGLTKYCRPNIFYNRAAPIQVNYLGYPGTTSIKNMDYIIADKTLIPPSDKSNYTEKIAYLPNSYQVNDSERPRKIDKYTRKDLKIPDDIFLFGCFNHIHKIQPVIFKCWMNILNKKKDSMLWLLCDDQEKISNIKKCAETNGINSNRILFAEVIDIESHYARIPLVDLMLDTYPYGAHTTASDTLWMGVPIISIHGNSFASRVSSSLLKAACLDELITNNIIEYENLINQIASNRDILNELKKKISSPHKLDLFNSKKTSEQIENLYAIMIKNYNEKKIEDIYLFS